MEQSGDLTKILRRSYFHIGFYFWITGIRYNDPKTTFKVAMEKFYRFYKVDERKYSKTSMRREFRRMQAEFDHEEIKQFAKLFSNDGKETGMENRAADSK